MKVIDALTLFVVAVVFGPFLVTVTVLGPLAKLIGLALDVMGK